MNIDQVIAAANLWRKKWDSEMIAQAMGLGEPVIYSNLWRIREVAIPYRRSA